MLHAAYVTSPFPHARVVSVDRGSIREMVSLCGIGFEVHIHPVEERLTTGKLHSCHEAAPRESGCPVQGQGQPQTLQQRPKRARRRRPVARCPRPGRSRRIEVTGGLAGKPRLTVAQEILRGAVPVAVCRDAGHRRRPVRDHSGVSVPFRLRRERVRRVAERRPGENCRDARHCRVRRHDMGERRQRHEHAVNHRFAVRRAVRVVS